MIRKELSLHKDIIHPKYLTTHKNQIKCKILMKLEVLIECMKIVMVKDRNILTLKILKLYKFQDKMYMKIENLIDIMILVKHMNHKEQLVYMK